MRRLTALPIAVVLALAGCASQPESTPAPSESSPPSPTSPAEQTPEPQVTPAAEDPSLGVEVTGAPDAKPEVKITTPLSVEDSVRKIVTKGEGEPVDLGDNVVLNFSLYNGRDGAELDSTYGAAPQTFPITEGLLRGVASGLLGAHVGDRLAIAIAPDEGFGERATSNYPGLNPDDTMVLVADLQRAYTPLQQAEGEAVPAKPGLPTVETDDEGKVTGITVPEDAKTPPTELVVQPLIQGSGPKVEAGQRITVHYTGVRLEDGEKFDSSWDKGQPFPTVIGQGQVIAGWDQGLVGQNVGSRVLLVIPQELAYADAKPGDAQPSGPLVFVVDILDAQ
ncbi:peptidylprolyl isomerase [Kineococcus xinjiangensis]|uniref:peptidylprolyl isomerase n=1 Tax=Kineococcus xinjiangensis TaxID=512762 RepID=A0A2S6IKE1_9ACTN|nr:FKBP-type peptidyl-prolyl cis-trans isomerase [Kineococcus xinjiangensis]PPK94697.1 peptidylprolyl isomerase [Kineococcus xinjiangensis]